MRNIPYCIRHVNNLYHCDFDKAEMRAKRSYPYAAIILVGLNMSGFFY
jgi:hypothetical protein